MKITALAKLAKETKLISMMDGERGQWVNVGTATYPMDGMPRMDEENILAVLGVPMEERSGYSVRRDAVNVLSPIMVDNLDDDQGADLLDMLLSVNGETLRPLYTPQGMVCIREAERKPIADSAKTYTWHVRMMGQTPLIVVKNGFQLIAILAPVKYWAQDNACEWLRDIARYAAMLNNQQHEQDPDDDRFSGMPM